MMVYVYFAMIVNFFWSKSCAATFCRKWASCKIYFTNREFEKWLPQQFKK